MARIAVAYCLHDDHRFLRESMASFAGAGDAFAFVNDVPHRGRPGDWRSAARLAAERGATVVEGSWPAEVLHRQGALCWLRARGYTHSLMPEADEIVDASLLASLLKVAEAGLAQRAEVELASYWKRPDVIVRETAPRFATLLVEIAEVYRHDLLGLDGRLFGGGLPLVLPGEHGRLHSLAFVGPDDRVRRKVETSGGLAPSPSWWPRVWKAWDVDPLGRDLHPVLPRAFAFAERVPVPDCLAGLAETETSTPPRFEDLPPVAAVIRDDGEGAERCLRALGDHRGLVKEVVAVGPRARPGRHAATGLDVTWVDPADHPSPESATLAAASLTSSPFLLFLHGGTLLPGVALEAMARSLSASATVAVVAPLTNAGAPPQRVEPTYTSLATLGLFAEAVAGRQVDDQEVAKFEDGCWLVRRSALEENLSSGDDHHGEAPCLRQVLDAVRGAGYRTLLCARAYAHRVS